MKSSIDLGREAGLQQFTTIIVDVLNANLESATRGAPGMAVMDAAHASPSDLLVGFENGVIISATEGKTGFEIGFIFTMKDMTTIADMMLMGEGEPKADLDSETKDAVMEFANQLFGGFTVPIDNQMSKKLQFRVDDATKLQNTTSFQSDNYISIDISGTLKGGTLQCRMYADEGFSSILENTGGNDKQQSIMPDFFGSSGEPSRSMSHSTSPNMEMLMDIEIPISVRMGSAQLFLKDILGLGPGNIVELDQNADESIELMVNDKIIARGEVVIVDGYFGFRIKEIISKAERIKRLKD